MTDLLAQYLETVAAHAPAWGFVLIFLLMAVESSVIPLPSEVVMIPAGFLAARGGLTFGDPHMDAFVAVIAGTAGSVAGAYANYYVAAWVGVPVLERYGKYFFLPPAKLHRAEEIFRQYGAGATFVCRLLPVMRHLISIPAGIARMPLGSFTLWTAIGACIWCAILTVIGYAIGVQTADMSYLELVHAGKDTASRHMVWLGPLLIVGFAVYVWVSSKIMQNKQAAEPSAEAR